MMIKYTVDEDVFFDLDKDQEVFRYNDFKRFDNSFGEKCSRLIDVHTTGRARIIFLRIRLSNSPTQVRLSSPATICMYADSSQSGKLFHVIHGDRNYTVWLPPTYGQYIFDESGRIGIPKKTSVSYRYEINNTFRLDLFMSGNVNNTAVVPYVLFEDPDHSYFDEIKNLNDTERRYYRKSDWFFARSFSDIWNYFINGSIYDPRLERGIERRFKCQQCAYAWWSYLGFLHKETGKKFYDILQNEIAFSVLLDMSEKGEWGHGFWSNDIETHSRFHLDGTHLLISQYEKTKEQIWLEYAEKGMSYVFDNLIEFFDDGSVWFLHDTKELFQKSQILSTLYGKSVGNTLCVNTHVQALGVLCRLTKLAPDNKIYIDMLENGMKSLKRVLDYQPGHFVYKLLMYLMMEYKKRLPGEFQKAGAARTAKEMIRNIYLKNMPNIFWWVRGKYPRIVYPGGFIERDLTLSLFSDRYHIINIKDLLILYHQYPILWLSMYIKNGLSFIRKYITEIDLITAISFSPYYIELIDVLYMYNNLIEPVTTEEMYKVENVILKYTEGYSLDYYTSELVHGELTNNHDYWKRKTERIGI